MNDHWEKLASVFVEILKLYQELLGLCHQKREVLVQSNMKELEKIVRQEEMLVLQVGKFEAISKGVIKELSVIYGLTGMKPTLSQIIQLADPDMQLTFQNTGQELRSVILKIAAVNEVNKKLVEQGLLIVNYSLNLLAQSAVGPTYHPNEQTSCLNKGFFDSKA